MTAGSNPIFFAIMGSVHPTSLAMSTVTAIVRQTANAVYIVISVLPSSMRSMSMIFRKQRDASATPQRTAVLISFQMTLGRSENSSSPRLRARMTVTEAWEPELPPVSMSMGMNDVKTTWAASAFSKPLMIMPVNVAEIMRSESQGMRWRKRSKVDERR